MRLNPYLAIIIAATLGGSSPVFVRLLDLPSTSISFFRTGVPVLLLGLYFLWKKRNIFRVDYKMMLLGSTLNAVRIFLYFVGYLYTTVGNAVIMLFTWPIFGTLFGVIFLKEKVSRRTALLVGLGFLGIVVMYVRKGLSFSSRDCIGMGAMLLSAILFSLMAIIFKKEFDNYDKKETIFFQNLVGAIVFLPFIVINRPLPTLTQTTIVSGYAILVGLIGFGLFFFALQKLKMSHYSLFTYWEVPAAILFGFVFFKEVITVNMVIGGGLIVLSGLLLRKKAKHKKISE